MPREEYVAKKSTWRVGFIGVSVERCRIGSGERDGEARFEKPVSVAAGPEFACHICARFCADADAGCRCAGSRVQCTLRNCARGGMSREFSNSGRPFPRSGIVRDDCAAESMSQPRPEAASIGSVIVEVLVERRGYSVFRARFYSVGSKSSPGSLAEPGRSGTPPMRANGGLRRSGARSYSRERAFS